LASHVTLAPRTPSSFPGRLSSALPSVLRLFFLPSSMPLVLLGLIYSQSSGSARAYFGLVLWRAAQPNLGLRPLSTPSCLLGPLRNPSGLQAPLRAYSGAVLVIFPIPSVFRPNSAHSVFVPGAIIIHRMRILYRCPAFTAQPASSFPLLHPPSSASAPISVLSCAVATGSSTVATGCSSEDSSCYPEDPGRSPEGSASSPKVSPMNSAART
jgi:hypothetical protein